VTVLRFSLLKQLSKISFSYIFQISYFMIPIVMYHDGRVSDGINRAQLERIEAIHSMASTQAQWHQVYAVAAGRGNRFNGIKRTQLQRAEAIDSVASSVCTWGHIFNSIIVALTRIMPNATMCPYFTCLCSMLSNPMPPLALQPPQSHATPPVPHSPRPPAASV
jgi:hypothetical protein